MDCCRKYHAAFKHRPGEVHVEPKNWGNCFVTYCNQFYKFPRRAFKTKIQSANNDNINSAFNYKSRINIMGPQELSKGEGD